MSDKGKNDKGDASAGDSGDDNQKSDTEKSSESSSGSSKTNASGDNKDNGDNGNDDASENGDSDSDENTADGDVIKVERTSTNPALLSQLRHSNEYHQARGLGAGKTGAATFQTQRITALALIPLAIWFAVSVVRLSTASQAAAAAWLAWPVNAAVMAVFVVIALRHAVIGVQIILEDYVDNEGLRAACVLVVKAIALVLGVASVAALIHLAL